MLKPFIEVPADEAWLYKNKAALKKVKIGLDQAKNGEFVDKGSFGKVFNNISLNSLVKG